MGTIKRLDRLARGPLGALPPSFVLCLDNKLCIKRFTFDSTQALTTVNCPDSYYILYIAYIRNVYVNLCFISVILILVAGVGTENDSVVYFYEF